MQKICFPIQYDCFFNTELFLEYIEKIFVGTFFTNQRNPILETSIFITDVSFNLPDYPIVEGSNPIQYLFISAILVKGEKKFLPVKDCVKSMVMIGEEFVKPVVMLYDELARKRDGIYSWHNGYRRYSRVLEAFNLKMK